MKKLYSAACALLGISIFRKIYLEIILFSNAEAVSPSKLYGLILCDYRFLVNFGLINFVLLTLLLIPRFVRWVLFGSALDQREVHSIKEKFNYTLFEFVWGLVILKNIDRDALSSKMVVKYACLFACLVLTKSFHYLCDIRVASQIKDISNGTFQRKSSLKLFMGINVLICTDLLVFGKVRDDIQTNSLTLIFGYEVINLFPLILLTLFNYLTSLYLLYRNRSPTPSSLSYTIAEFSLNLIRMTLFITYTWVFNQNFTFPVHMIPSSYKCLRLLLTKTRSLIIYKRNMIKFEKYHTLPKVMKLTMPSRNDTCFCLDDFTTNDTEEMIDVRRLHCGHAFHYECLKWWLVKSETCPICRDKVHFQTTLTQNNIQRLI